MRLLERWACHFNGETVLNENWELALLVDGLSRVEEGLGDE